MKAVQNLELELEKLLSDLNHYLIIAPPRSASTSLARVLFNNSKIKSYDHEPCDYYCHDNAGIESIINELKKHAPDLIKEMTFQMGTGKVSKIFLEKARKPIIFQIRHPHLTIESRIRMVLNVMLDDSEVQESIKDRIKNAVSKQVYDSLDDILTEKVFPLEYIGWEALENQIMYCNENDISYIVTDAYDFRNHPKEHVTELCKRLGLEFEDQMINWEKAPKFIIANLPEQAIWYKRILEGKGIEPPLEVKITLGQFPNRFRDSTIRAVKIYENTKKDSNNICK
ncbi:MAG: hypothetical protein U9Q67_02125 [Patescibacteria group bacterium]|nr:hypothetical protein [Patescibacteria group bacterium]